jgi:hypothetical protein
MQESSKTEARDSTRVYAGHLSHLVRYCYEHRIEFFDFTDEHLYKFTEQLKAIEKNNSIVKEEYIGDNHVRAIQQRSLNFLVWISNKYPELSQNLLIGEEGENAKVTIFYKINPFTGKREISHRYIVHPTPDKDDKGVITEGAIQSILNAIFKAHDISQLPQRALTKLKADKDLFIARNTYLYERRLFCIRLLKLSGLRPEELVDIPINENRSVVSNRNILIPTKKQGYPAPLRKFEVTIRAALDFQRYINQRAFFIEFLTSRSSTYVAPASLLLNEDGDSIKKESLTREFSRLCKSANLLDVRTCLSMFRHRFITREMHLLMLLRFQKNPELRESWTPAFKEEVCLIVKEKTGHRKAKSLYTYFDEEHRLLRSDPGREDRLDTVERLESAQESLVDLKFRSQLSGDHDAAIKIAEIEADIIKLYRKLLGDSLPD